MVNEKDYSQVSALVVGGGPTGLAAAIVLKKRHPDHEVLVLDKASGPGEHNLSGAVLEAEPLTRFFNSVKPGWDTSPEAQEILGRAVQVDNVYMFPNERSKISMTLPIRVARLLHLGVGGMAHKGDLFVSVTKLTKWLCVLAEELGVVIRHGYTVDDIILNEPPAYTYARGVTLLGQNGTGETPPLPQTIRADAIVLAEGSDGLVTEKFIAKAGLQREAHQLHSVCVKEIIRVSPEQYARFGANRCVRALGYPLWKPFTSLNMFGGGVMYAMDDQQIAVCMIVGADWEACDFNPQDALARFKEHEFVRSFVEGGEVVEAGAKIIPEGGYRALPRYPETGAIGRGNVLIAGDSAGFVNTLKIKGLHNALGSGAAAGQAVAQTIMADPEHMAEKYTAILEADDILPEMRRARNFRQTIARFGNTLGIPLSALGGLLPTFDIKPDYQTMKPRASYPHKLDRPFDKNGFVAKANVHPQPDLASHCEVRDERVCKEKCADEFNRPCITFCPAGVYEMVNGQMKPAHPDNCLHCKTCQNKCPHDNLRWHAPEKPAGPKYVNM